MNRQRPANYHTRQGDRILDYLRSLGDRHVTVTQVARYFADSGDLIGQTTIYRHLEKLAAEGTIRKYALSDGKSACYQYAGASALCREHFHLVCESCGVLIHADCELLDEVEAHLLAAHDFHINMLKTVFYGTCKRCLSADPALKGGGI
jgi:Fur family ferric uptake transcriptional regulator